MKVLVLLLILVCSATKLAAQKKVLDIEEYRNWTPDIEKKISAKGNYATLIRNGQLTIHYLKTGARKNIPGAFNPFFSRDERFVCFLLPGDSLGTWDLLNDSLSLSGNVTAYSILQSGSADWIAYEDREARLHLFNVVSRQTITISNVAGYKYYDQGSVLLARIVIHRDSTEGNALLRLTIPGFKRDTLWSGGVVGNFVADNTAEHIAFIASGKEDDQQHLYLAECKQHFVPARIDEGDSFFQQYRLADGMLKFDSDASRLFFTVDSITGLQGPTGTKALTDVDVWNYKDNILQSVQLGERKADDRRTVVYNFSSRKLIVLNERNESVISLNETRCLDYVLVLSNMNTYEKYWLEEARASCYLVSTSTGARTTIFSRLEGYSSAMNQVVLSPENRFVVYYDTKIRRYNVYDVRSGVCRDVSAHFSFPLDNAADDPSWYPVPYGMAAWGTGDSSFYIYDKYDIWRLDPLGQQAPHCITGMQGRKGNTQLRMVRYTEDLPSLPVISTGEQLLLIAFSPLNKENGFYSLKVGQQERLRLLTMGPYLYYWPFVANPGKLPLKASAAEIYLVERMSAAQYPNVFWTRDFKSFVAITDDQPQKKYNWMTAELVHWPVAGRSQGTGILYKPENFDPARKYPVIFYFYDKLSDGLHQFLMPGYSTGAMNIPYFVSNGYLVLVPDIYFTKGSPGESSLAYVASAARFMTAKPWVDKACLGIQGHSFGGYQVNYIVTHSNMFRAACAASGTSNLTTAYGNIRLMGSSGQDRFETGQYRIGKTLWKDVDAYVRNSPVFFTNRIQTPLLLVSNKKDVNVLWGHGIEMFTALRRQHKPAWLLQYDGSAHAMSGNDALDFSIRLGQFFDHYLKGLQAPEWMTVGITAGRKGLETGFSADSSGRKP